MKTFIEGLLSVVVFCYVVMSAIVGPGEALKMITSIFQ